MLEHLVSEKFQKKLFCFWTLSQLFFQRILLQENKIFKLTFLMND